MDSWAENISQVGKEKHPRSRDKVIQYGTAGFRTKACELDHVMYRMGVLAVIRSKYKEGSTIGVMITASHNPEEDNGVKLVDPLGEMLEVSWESWATKLANANDDDLAKVVKDLVTSLNINIATHAAIVVGRDTRPSSPSLSQAVTDGVTAAGGACNDYGILSTPQLHYMVACINTKGVYGEATEEGYYNKLAQAFLQLRGQNASNGKYSPHLYVDGANGVGAGKMMALLTKLGDALSVKVVNDGSSGKLNYQCGADFVKVQQKAPEGLTLEPGVRCASFDGDADRIVYYYANKDNSFRLMDGDKIATLVAGFLKESVSGSGLHLNLGLVQTAYANGQSTAYIMEKLKVPVACVPTGVKHLHHKALEYDVGVYFEANGHGTVLFKDSAIEIIDKAAADQSLSAEQLKSAKKLKCVVDVINQTVGDAISDLLLVETVLHSYGWSVEDWNTAYTDLPNRQIKVKVADRNVVKTTDAERQTTSPPGLQDAVNKHVAKYNNGRSFVRPSGTEDVVRVYAEADTQFHADQLAYEVGMSVYELANGQGDKPSPPVNQ